MLSKDSRRIDVLLDNGQRAVHAITAGGCRRHRAMMMMFISCRMMVIILLIIINGVARRHANLLIYNGHGGNLLNRPRGQSYT